MIIFLLDLSPPLVLIVAVLIYKCCLVLIKVWGRDSFLSFLSFSIVCALINCTSGDKTESFLMFTREQARKSGMAESEQLVDGPFGAAPCKADPGGRGEAGVITGRAGWVRTRPRHPRVISTSVDGLGSRPEGFPLAGFSLRCPGGQTGQIPSIDETPRPPSEQGTCPLPGLATDNIGYQTASSGSDEAATGLLERYSGGHTQDHTVGYTHHTNQKQRQPPASPPGHRRLPLQALHL